jgi:hypothetical protein
MKYPIVLAAVFLTQNLLTQSLPAQTASLLIRTDLECRWSVDGEPQGVLKTGDRVRLSLPLGEHRLEAVPMTGGPRWEEVVQLGAAEGQELTIPLQAAVARAEAQQRGYWTDPETKLMWPTADNGSGVTWSQASYYCGVLTLGGHKDWTLPSIDDLHRLFGGAANQNGFHIAAPIKLTGWEWSSSEGKEPGEQWSLDFGDGARASVVTGDSGLNRALCVRRDTE